MQKHFKKLLALLLALTMAVGAVPSVFAAEPETLTGTVEYFSTDNRAFVEDTYTYSDAWFFEDPAERNDALALVSMQLVAAATDEGKGIDFLSELGFTASGSVADKAENRNADHSCNESEHYHMELFANPDNSRRVKNCHCHNNYNRNRQRQKSEVLKALKHRKNEKRDYKALA